MSRLVYYFERIPLPTDKDCFLPIYQRAAEQVIDYSFTLRVFLIKKSLFFFHPREKRPPDLLDGASCSKDGKDILLRKHKAPAVLSGNSICLHIDESKRNTPDETDDTVSLKEFAAYLLVQF